MKNLLSLSLLFAYVATVNCQPEKVTNGRLRRISPTARAVAKAMPGVVNLNTEKIIDSFPSGWNPDFFDFSREQHFLGKHKGYSLGSGSIIASAGLVVTNAHVVRRAVKIRATLNNGRSYLAETVASDDLNDVALLKLTGQDKPLQPLQMASPGDLILGETVIVVGNPYGLGSSISRGVLSAIGRKVTYNRHVLFSDLLQTDAAVFAGSSGGPLININGKMIGITTAMLKGAPGIAFAIPLQRVENILAAWLIPERFSNVQLGIVPAVKRQKDGQLDIYLKKVVIDSPAWQAGLRPGMKINRLNGKKLDDLMELGKILWKLRANDRIVLETANGSRYELQARQLMTADGQRLAELKLGIRVQPLTAGLAEALKYPFKGGLLISGVPEKGVTDLERGDILLRLGDTAIHSPQDISKALRNVRYGEKVSAALVKVINRLGKYYILKKHVTFTAK